jgi:tetratricopeptide (TPR) repeat protein
MKQVDLGPRREALREMFRQDIDGAHELLDGYLDEHPKDALAHSLNAAVTFYHHISERMPEGPREMLAMVLLGKGVPFPAALRKSLEIDLGRARGYAVHEDAPDLLALAIVEGVKRDYLALVCKKWLESFDSARKANAHARHLLNIDPSADDAYFVLGMTEYMVHRIPSIIRPFAPIEGIRGELPKAIRYCQRALQSGNYFQEFARRLLVDLYLDEGRRADALTEIRRLADEFPENRGIVKDLNKISALK